MNFFEVSKTFEVGKEITRLGIVLSGNRTKTIHSKELTYDFYDMKGIFEEIMNKLNIKNYEIRRTENNSLHTGRAVDVFVGKDCLGCFGQIHPDLEENFDIESKNTIYLELNIDSIRKYMKKNIKYKSISKYQSVTRDLAFVVKDDVLVGSVIKSVEKLDKIIQKVDLFDVYKGVGVEDGHKSFAISILMRDDNKTLEEKEINSVLEKIKDKVINQFNAEMRK